MDCDWDAGVIVDRGDVSDVNGGDGQDESAVLAPIRPMY